MLRLAFIFIGAVVVAVSGGCDHIGIDPERLKQVEKPYGAFTMK